MSESVLKGGGSSISIPQYIDNFADIIIQHYFEEPKTGVNVVASAFGTDPLADKKIEKVTNRLLKSVDSILEGKYEDAKSQIKELKEYHYSIIDELGLDKNLVDSHFSRLERTANKAIRDLKKGEKLNEGKLSDAIVSAGELCSTPILAAVVQNKLEDRFKKLEERVSQGSQLNEKEQVIYEKLKSCNNQYSVVVDDPANLGFITDSNFKDATILDKKIDEEIGKKHQKLREKYKNSIIFVPGFIGRNQKWQRTTLGRDGSNDTAAALGKAIKAKIILYSDVEGTKIYKSKFLDKIQKAKFLTYNVAALLSKWGSMKSIQDKAKKYLMRPGPYPTVWVKSSFNPEDPGTRITVSHDPQHTLMSGIGIIDNVSIRQFNVESEDQYKEISKIITGWKGIEILREAYISTGGIKSAEFVLSRDPDLEGKLSSDHFIKHLFREIREKVYAGEKIKGGFQYHGASVITISGPGIANSFKDKAKIDNILANAGWDKKHKKNLRFVPLWSYDKDAIHFAIRKGGVDDAVSQIYHSMKRINLVHNGLGPIGKEFLTNLRENYEEMGINIVSVVDSSGGIMKSGGLNKKDLRAIINYKREGVSIKDMKIQNTGYLSPEECRNFHSFAEKEIGEWVTTDTTSNDQMPGLLIDALDFGWVVGANKLPLSYIPTQLLNKDPSKFSYSQEKKMKIQEILYKAILEKRYLNRATVGANIGVPDELLEVLDKNPSYVTTMGCISGTLGYTSDSLEKGIDFSDAINSAYKEGLTERKPFVDFSGRDVLNKTWILWGTIATHLGRSMYDVEINYESFLAPAIKLLKEKYGGRFNEEELHELEGPEFTDKVIELDLDKCFNDLLTGLKDNEVYRYVGEIRHDSKNDKYSINVGLRKVPKMSPLGLLSGTTNQVLIGADSPPESPAKIPYGPGAGIDVTAKALMKNLKDAVDMARSGLYEIPALALAK